MKLIILFILGCVNFTFSQAFKKDTLVYIAKYNLNFQIDSLNVNSKVDEQFYLIGTKNFSKFQSINSFKKDSLINNSDNNLSILNISQYPKSKFLFDIYKTKDQIIHIEYIYKNVFQFKENKNLKWKLFDEIKIINGYICNKAQLDYKGRKYIAYYSKEISIPDGPYKFYGLPGIIVSINDEKNEVSFNLISLKTYNNTIFNNYVSDDVIMINRDEFYKALIDNKTTIIQKLIEDGVVITEEIKERILRKSKRENNRIELKQVD